MLANDELGVRCYIDQPLRSDGAEAASARITVVDGYHGKVVVNASANPLVSAHRPRIDLLSAFLSLRSKLLHLICR